MTVALETGRSAFEAKTWADASASLTEADSESPLGLDDLERLATAAYLSGHDGTSTDAWSRAYRVAIEHDEPERAVLAAFWLGFGLFQRGEVAQGGGWMARAGQLVGDRALDCVGCGYLLVPMALMRLDAGDDHQAFELFDQAGVIADRFDDPDLTALARLGRGQALYGMDRRDQGAELFDQVMVSVTNGEVSPVVSGIVYCAVVDQCQRAFDIGRAYEWTIALTRWCEAQPGLVPYRGQCLVHRSQVLQLHGAWSDALDEAVRAQKRLTEPPHPAVGMAHYQLGELRRLRGDMVGAEEAYRRAQECGRPPQPGMALNRWALGDLDAAVAMIDTALAETDQPVLRSRLLPAFVDIMVAAGDLGRARSGADELDVAASDHGAPFLGAAAGQASGAVLIAQGDPRAALAHLRSAWDRWRDLEAPYETAQTQVLMARACTALGDVQTARLQATAARRTFAQLGASVALEQMRDLIEPDVPAGEMRTESDATISPREVQVLRRVAQGRTNRQIADELFISIKTVERHLSNIFTKLGAANRAAATAIAHDRNLL